MALHRRIWMPAIPLCRGGDVRVALDNGVAAATLVSKATAEIDDGQLRFAFDGDAVLFSDEAEQVFKREVWTPLLPVRMPRVDDP